MNTIRVPVDAWGEDSVRELTFPDGWGITQCTMKGHDAPAMDDEEIRGALGAPLGAPTLAQMARGRKQVVILFDDLLRPTPASRIVPFVLEELHRGGIGDDQIRFVAAVGSHQLMMRDDFVKKLGEEIVERYPVYNHNIYDNLVDVGETSQGTRVLINREVAACDLKVGIGGAISYFGKDVYNGGSKIILPGVCGIETILDFHTGARAREQQRPVDPGDEHVPAYRLNSEEAARLAGLDIKVDCVLNNRRQVVGVFAGDFVKTHRRASVLAKEIYATPVAPPSDVVVMNTYPKEDQPTTGLWIAMQSVREGGDVVIVSHSASGLSHPHYLFGRFGTEFGGRAWAPGRRFGIGGAGRVIFCSPYLTKLDMDSYQGEGVLFVKMWDEARAILEGGRFGPASVAVYPYAGIQMAA